MARKQPRRSLLWRLAKWCGFSSPLVIVVALAGRLLGIDTSWFIEAETSQGKALIQAISKAAQNNDGRDTLEPPARVSRGNYIGPPGPPNPSTASRNDWRPPPPPAGIAPPPPRASATADAKKTADRRNDELSFPSPQIRR